MEFIKVGKNYMIKNSNGRIVTEEEKIKLENRELEKQPIFLVSAKTSEGVKELKKNNRLFK